MNHLDLRPQLTRHIESAQICCDPAWEAAYERFETPEEEVAKFVRRLKAFGLQNACKQAEVVELFCGRGGGLIALNQLGFSNIHGVDLSESLLQQYRGPGDLHLADCRKLPFGDDQFDIAIVQGGLHHLPNLPDDLDAVLAEVNRVLKPKGMFYVVEPWMTPFLRIVHTIVEQPLIRKFYRKGDALATMTDHERDTYEQWLSQPELLLRHFHNRFEPVQEKIAWGKLAFAGAARG